MNNIKIAIILVGLFCFNCNQSGQTKDKTGTQSDNIDIQKEKSEIQILIRQVLIWSDTCRTFDLYPAISDKISNSYIGFDMKKVKDNMTILKQTGFFSKRFIENYNEILKTLDKKLRNKSIEWMVGDLQTFNYNMSYIDVNPWCLCQGFSISEFDDIEVKYLNSTSGDFKFKWTKDSDWIDFKFCTVKENNKWKISYMEGFDFKENNK